MNFKTTAFILILILTNAFTGYAQCPTVLSTQQEQWLTEALKRIDEGYRYKTGSINFIPVKIHLVGNNEGKGYMRVDWALENLCKLNRDFAPVGMYFYLAAEINYIDNNDLFQGLPQGVYDVAGSEKAEGMLNIFYTGSAPGWCGVYYFSPDVVLLQIACAQPGNTTLTHEVGHFFGLPHTFSGWENGRTPPASQQERVDGTNCRNTADRFCDTKPDYVSFRWGCNFPDSLTDPTGAKFKPDPTLYMNYAGDNCHSRFSNEQILAMNDNAEFNRGWNFPAVDTLISNTTTLLYPAEGDSSINPEAVNLKWQKVGGAIGYLVQVARVAYWEVLNINQVIWNDTVAQVKLFDEWPFSWRVRAIFPGNVCAPFSQVGNFYTKPLLIGLENNNTLKDLVKIYPNPVGGSKKFSIDLPAAAMISIYSADGRLVLCEKVSAGHHEYADYASGVYFIQIQMGVHTMIEKLIW